MDASPLAKLDPPASAEPATAELSYDPAAAQRMLRSIIGMLAYDGFTMSINGVGAPWITQSFHLGEAGIARLFAWISLSALGALGLSRMVDRVGRRRILRLCMYATPICALGAALATNLVVFGAIEIALYAFIGATVSGSIVMLAEELPVEQRAMGQSRGGLALSIGGGICVILLPILTTHGYSWRWALVLAAAGIFFLPAVARVIPESRRWERAAMRGATSSGSFYDVFRPPYRSRAIPILICALLSTIVATAANSWSYFHAVSTVKLGAAKASAMMLTGGGVGAAGFFFGARTCERFGRVPTAVIAGALIAVGAVLYFWGPPAAFPLPAIWLVGAYTLFMFVQNTATVAGNSVATELFPTAIRGTMMGWFALIAAIAAVTAQAAIAVLAGRLGGLSEVVGYLSLLAIPSAIVFWTFIPETRGLSLEAAAREAP